MILYSKSIKKILITGGAGFIGGTLIRKLLLHTDLKIFNLDKLCSVSNLTGIDQVINEKNIAKDRYKFLKIDLTDLNATTLAIREIDPDIVFHLAAATHVDKSIIKPKDFIEDNIYATYNLLESLLSHWQSLEEDRKSRFKLIHVSTDEVFGSLGETGSFSEISPYSPRSPYSATKAASDHLVKAWYHTYKLPTIVTNSSNNFGPWQFPEKLIPVVINNAISGIDIPVYGDGNNIRDWIFVDDHIEALIQISIQGVIGHSYCIGAEQEKTNLEIVYLICDILDKLNKTNVSHSRLIKFVEDRKGHDFRYSINTKKIKEEISWKPKYNFSEAMEITVKWYLNNFNWCQRMSKIK